MLLGMEVGLDSGHIVLDWVPAPSPKSGTAARQFLAHVYCGQTAGWIRMPLGMEVGLSPCHIVSDGDPPPFPKGAQQLPPLLFGPCVLWPNG